MLPIHFNNFNFPPQNPALMYQAYQSMMQQSAYNNMLLASQGQSLQYQYHQMMQMNAQLLHNNLQSQAMTTNSKFKAIKTTPLGSEISSSPSSAIFKPQIKMEAGGHYELYPTTKMTLPDSRDFSKGTIKDQLKEMITELVDKIGRPEKEEEISTMRTRYASNADLTSIFDSVVSKFLSIKKHREDIVRFIMRKALKAIKSAIVKKEKVYGKKAYAVLCRKYFAANCEELKKSGINMEDEKELIEFLLPYRKNSKNRTINNTFTSEIFASKEFQEDYNKFLRSFNTSIADENYKKTQKLIILAEECLEKKSTLKIKKCVRLPWLQVWIEKAQKMAIELPKMTSCKIEPSDQEGTEDNDCYGEEEGNSTYSDDEEEEEEEEKLSRTYKKRKSEN